jgi:carbamoyl-phosphate synthase large subunit
VNIILTCCGRRNYLVNYFKTALAGKGQVLATDASPDAVSLQEADRSFVLPLVSDPTYFDKLLAICQDYKPKILVSLNDLELPMLAKQRERFISVGTEPVVSSPSFIDICFDKWATNRFLSDHDIITPKTYLTLAAVRQAIEQEEIGFPLVVKPRWGSGSIGIVYAENHEELDLSYKYVKSILNKTFLATISSSDPDKCVMIQEKIIGQEYGLDIINDLDGNYVAVAVKQKLSMRSGETDRAITVHDNRLTKVGEKLGRCTRHIGNLDCDFMVNEKGTYVIEMNPRFGGGYPFSHLAGLDLPATLIAWANQEEINPNWLKYKSGVMSSKCDRLITHTQHHSFTIRS